MEDQRRRLKYGACLESLLIRPETSGSEKPEIIGYGKSRPTESSQRLQASERMASAETGARRRRRNSRSHPIWPSTPLATSFFRTGATTGFEKFQRAALSPR